MAIPDWSQCPAVESVPGRLSGAWVFRDTRMPVSAVFQNLEAGATIDEITEWFHISKEQVIEVLEFAARSLAVPVPVETVSALEAVKRGEEALQRGEYLSHEQVGQRLQRFLQQP
jgi:uncharacterized protein (DUF433 family)